MADRLAEYRRKRDATRTPEPVPVAEPEPEPEPGTGTAFVIHQHHARRLHWDLRLEHDGVLASWAIPRGIPRDPARNHLAVHTEDHPMEYLDFHGEIPAGEYGAGRMTVYDQGTYTAEKWRDNEVIVVLRGNRTTGRYALFQTAGKDWMIHRMDPVEPGWTPMPEHIAPMLPTNARTMSADDAAYGYELSWDGVRAVAYVSGGRLRLMSAEDRDITAAYRELGGLAESLAPTECVLDGEIVAFDAGGRISPSALRRRATESGSRQAQSQISVQYLAFDLLWLDGASTVDLPYAQRRASLDSLGIGGAHWQAPPYFTGAGRHAMDASRGYGLQAVVAKRLDAPYQPGRRTRAWQRIANDAG
jgi:bifunctional non-homologous end joining protein LigD